MPLLQRAEIFINSLLEVIKPDYKISFIKKTNSINMIDAAVAKPVKPEFVTTDIVGLGEITGICEPRIGMAVKRAVTSGITSSEINAMDVVIKVMLGPKKRLLFISRFSQDQWLNRVIVAP